MSDVPSLDEQREQIKQIEENADTSTGTQKLFMVDSFWYRDWQRASSAYLAPGQIDNKYLVDTSGKPKYGLSSSDYVLVLPTAWEKLFEWYGGGPVLEVEAEYDAEAEKFVLVETISLTALYEEKKEEIQARTSMTVKQLKEQLMSTFNVPDDRETRIVDWYQGRFYAVLSNDQRVSECRFIQNQQIKLDEKGEDGQWKAQEETTKYSTSYATSYNTTTYTYSGYNYGYGSSSYYSHGGSYGAYIGPGKVGFSNLGNTCFFNSGVQCLMHTMTLMNVFLNTDWKADLNEANPISSHGNVTRAFADLVQDVWKGQYGVVSPSALKGAIGQFASQFAGWGQQDSHELIMSMLDAIHEDLNRCRQKPQVEPVFGDSTNDAEIAEKAWANHKLRNDSVIVDRFYGLLKSELYCPQCHSTTVVFDPYSSVPLPLQEKQLQTIKGTFCPLDPREPRCEVALTLPSVPKQDDVSKAVSELLGREVKAFLGVCDANGKLEWASNCGDADGYYSKDFYIFEVDDTSKFWVPCVFVMKVYNTYRTYAEEKPFYLFLLSFDSDEVTEENIAKKAEEYLEWMWKLVEESSESEDATPKSDAEEQRHNSEASTDSELRDIENEPQSTPNDEMSTPIEANETQKKDTETPSDSELRDIKNEPQSTPNDEMSTPIEVNETQKKDTETPSDSELRDIKNEPQSTPNDEMSTPIEANETLRHNSEASTDSEFGDIENEPKSTPKVETQTSDTETSSDSDFKDSSSFDSSWRSASDPDGNTYKNQGYTKLPSNQDTSTLDSFSSDSDILSNSPTEQSKPVYNSYGTNYSTSTTESLFDPDNTGLTPTEISWKDRIQSPTDSFGENVRFKSTLCHAWDEYNPKLNRGNGAQFMADRFAFIHISRDYVTKKSGFDINTIVKLAMADPPRYSQPKPASSDSVTLDSCFRFFSTSEVLDEENQWFCPKCRVHVCATKKLDIWSVPDILIIQLKRFITGSWKTKKLETPVDYPDELDMSQYVIGPQKGTPLKYKFYAVSEHMGVLGGGHYVAHAAVQDEHGNEQWYYFNDSSASVASRENAHTALAYVLFYVREGAPDSVMSQWEHPLTSASPEDDDDDVI